MDLIEMKVVARAVNEPKVALVFSQRSAMRLKRLS